MIVKQISEKPNGYQQLTVSSTAVGLTVPTGSSVAVIIVESNPVRYRDDGTNPTAAVGTPVLQDQSVEVTGDALAAIRFIRSGASDGTLNINYYK